MEACILFSSSSSRIVILLHCFILFITVIIFRDNWSWSWSWLVPWTLLRNICHHPTRCSARTCMCSSSPREVSTLETFRRTDNFIHVAPSNITIITFMNGITFTDPFIVPLKFVKQERVASLSFGTKFSNFLKPIFHLPVVANIHQLVQPFVLQPVSLFGMDLQQKK